MLNLIVKHQVFLIPALAWLIAQLTKVFLSWHYNRKANWSLVFAMGGMPSAHTTLVCALTTTVGVVEGTDTTAFAIALCLAAIVIYDAAGVRQTVSAQSIIINRILDEYFKGNPKFEHRLRELIGHTRIEVLFGLVLGIITALICMSILHLLSH
jgi:uncharacterized protein